jgi:hypothetical protein
MRKINNNEKQYCKMKKQLKNCKNGIDKKDIIFKYCVNSDPLE